MSDANVHQPVNGFRPNSSAETVIVARPAIKESDSSNSDSVRAEVRRQVALVEGSTPHMTSETRDLLKNRLRLAAILFFVGFFVFLVRWFFYWDEWISQRLSLFLTHGLVTIVM